MCCFSPNLSPRRSLQRKVFVVKQMFPQGMENQRLVFFFEHMHSLGVTAKRNILSVDTKLFGALVSYSWAVI